MFKRETVSLGFLAAAALIVACGKPGGGADNQGGDSEGGSGAGGTSGVAGEAGQNGTGGTDPGGAGGQAGGQPTTGGAGGVDQGGTGGTGGSVPAQGGMGGGGGQVQFVLEPCATNPYCNNFESIAVGERPLGFKTVSAGNKMSVAENKAFSGKRSLYIEAASGTAMFTVFLGERFKNPKRVGYARMMVWMENLPGASGSSHWNIMGMSGATKVATGNGGSAGISFGGPDGNPGNWFIYLGANSDCTKRTQPPVLPLQQWVCVEQRVDESTTTNYGVSINGKEITALSLKWNATGASCVGGASNIWNIPDVQSFGFGWNHYHAQNTPIKMWIDDVVVDEKPIGCP